MPKKSTSKTPSPAADREATGAALLLLIAEQKQYRQAHLNCHIETRGLSPDEADKDECCNYWQGGVHALEELERRLKKQNATAMASADPETPSSPENE